MLTFICGVPGAGKTLLLTHLAVQSMLSGNSDIRKLKREIKVLNNGGYNLTFPPQKHLTYADYTIRVNKRLSAYNVNGFEIGLANPYFYTTYFPPFSTIFLDGAQRYYDSRMSRYLRDDVYHWYQLHRHNDYNIYMACQRLGNIDLNLRSLGECFIVIDKLEVKSNVYGMPTKITWHIHRFRSCDMAENYILAKDKHEDSKLGEKTTITANYNVFAYYNSKSCRPAFYGGLSDYEYAINNGYYYSAESYAEYNNTHSFSAPIGYWKNADYDKKVLQRLGVTDYAN